MAPGLNVYDKAVQSMMNKETYGSFSERLIEFDHLRLQAMDEAGIDLCVLSQTSPGVQIETDKNLALSRAAAANDFLAQRISDHPTRFSGFAHLALQDPSAAIKELRRCVEELGFVGALINGHTNGIYLDDPTFTPFWESVAELDVPVYLHPADPYDLPHMLKGRPELFGPTWAWTMETATHVLRLVASGLFDRIPSLKIIVGHMGEALPFMLWRLDSRWKIMAQHQTLKLQPSQYLKQHILVTTAGVCDYAPLLCTLSAVGEDHVLFSTDYPYESIKLAADFIDNAPLSVQVKEKVAYGNAQRWLKLGCKK